MPPWTGLQAWSLPRQGPLVEQLRDAATVSTQPPLLCHAGGTPNSTFVCDPGSVWCYSMELLPLAFTAAAQSCAAKSGQLVQYYSGAQQNFVEGYFK